MNVGVDTVTRHEDAANRSTEVVPALDASVPGGCLVTMGVPHGDRTTLEHLPPAIWEVPQDVRYSFVRIYIMFSLYRHMDRGLITEPELLWVLDSLDDHERSIEMAKRLPVG